MNHEEAVEQLHMLLYGELDEPLRSDLEDHLLECEACRSMKETYRVLRETLEQQAQEAGEHPSPDDIVAWAVERNSLSQVDQGRIEAHVGDCRLCQDEASRVRQVEMRMSEDRKPSEPQSLWGRIDWRRPEVRLALAATVLIALLIYPAFLGVSTLSDRGGAWSGTAPLRIVRSGLRETGGRAAVHVDPGSPIVVLGVEVRIPLDIPADDKLRFEIVRQDNETAVQIDMTAGEAREQIRSTGIVTLAVPSASLEEGPHEFRVTRRGDPDRAALLQVHLDVDIRAP